MICSTQKSAFDVPRGLRVKLHVTLGYWIKLRNPWSQSAKYTLYPFSVTALLPSQTAHDTRFLNFILNKIYLLIQRTEKLCKRMSPGCFWVTFRSVSVIVWNMYHVRPGGVCTSRLGSRRPSWMMQFDLQFSVSSLLITWSDGVEWSSIPAQSDLHIGYIRWHNVTQYWVTF
jgi:hypothetical protein